MKEHETDAVERVEGAILVIRGQRVILDADLAALYGVPVHRLNEQVRRNIVRFPEDFVFRLMPGECANLRSQIAISSLGGRHGGRRYAPLAFSEHGAIMAASVLNSPKAVEMSILVVRAFVKLRAFLATHCELADKLRELEAKLSTHDDQIVGLVAAIRALMTPPEKPKRRIGFRGGES